MYDIDYRVVNGQGETQSKCVKYHYFIKAKFDFFNLYITLVIFVRKYWYCCLYLTVFSPDHTPPWDYEKLFQHIQNIITELHSLEIKDDA